MLRGEVKHTGGEESKIIWAVLLNHHDWSDDLLYTKVFDATLLEVQHWQKEVESSVGKDWSEWLDAAIINSSGSAAYKLIKKKTEKQGGVSKTGEIEIQQKIWHDIWNRDLKKRPQLLKDIDYIRQLHSNDETFTRERWDQVISQLRKGAGKGVDQVDRDFLDKCSEGSRNELYQIAKEIVREQVWPVQNLVALIAMQPKPGSEGMRPIALLTMIYRLLTKAIRTPVAQWDELHAESWDWNIKGRGAEAASFHESMEAELIQMSGDYIASGLLDMTKFYDNVSIDWLIKTAQHLRFPRTALILGVEVMMSWRMLQIGHEVREIGVVGNGIVPGDPFATSFARCYLYPALLAAQSMAMKLKLDMRLRVFVDDVRCRVAAKTQTEAAQGAANVLNRFLNCLQDRQCEINKGKTILMGTTAQVRRELDRRLKNAGWDLQTKKQAKDLGTDSALGGKRRVAVQTSRAKRARTEHWRLLRWSRQTGKPQS